MASFEAINYSTRINKNIERKLIFEGLRTIGDKYSFLHHTYVGMGSMWFSDFALAHRQLLISDMISFELPDYAARADFNRPYDCIKVIAGDTTTQLPHLEWSRPMLIWLDYDSDYGGPLFDDLPLVADNASPGTVVMVTINCHVQRLPTVDENDQPLSRPQAIEKIWGEYIPLGLKPIKQKNYSVIAAASMFNLLKEGVRKRGKNLTFMPLFNFKYADGAPMITIGGIVVDQKTVTEELIRSSDAFSRCDYLTAEEQFEISAPPFTQKEKHALDRMMPSSRPPKEHLVQSKFGFTVAQDMLDNYHKFYRMYPTFGEVTHS
jgi:hypothetical protein